MNAPTFERTKQKRGVRNIYITRKGLRILRAVERGTYKFMKPGDNKGKDGRFR